MEVKKGIKMPKKNIDREAKKLLIEVLSRLKKTDELVLFLENLLSSSEVKDISRRLLAAKYLQTGKTYEEVEKILGMGSGTINKIR